jgi:hypothetical protein
MSAGGVLKHPVAGRIVGLKAPCTGRPGQDARAQQPYQGTKNQKHWEHGYLQGLDDAFQQTPKEHDLDDYFDPSDPSDRQQIEWRQGGGDSPGQAAAEHANGTSAKATSPLSPGALGGRAL